MARRKRTGFAAPKSRRRPTRRARRVLLTGPAALSAEVGGWGRKDGALGIKEFLKRAEGEALTVADRNRIIEQALLLLQDFYVHLPLKRAMHACDPVQRLRLLRQRHPNIDDRRFHESMTEIFASVRDLHTNYLLPRPFNDKVALLPFMLEECYEPAVAPGARPVFLVTKVLPGIGDPDFAPGVRVTHWNGVPIDRVVDVSASREPGSNEAARHARGIERLTMRALRISAVPDEEWVVVSYRKGDAAKEVRLAWQVVTPGDDEDGDATVALGAQLQGVDLQRQIVSRVRKTLFAPKEMERERAVRAARGRRKAVALAGDSGSLFPQALSFSTADGGKYGYIRIWTFAVPDEMAFANEFARICGLLPQEGLIIDVRGNGGGYIRAGEMLLQLLTPRRVEPERFHFINSSRTLDLCERVQDLTPWAGSIRQAVETGAVYSQGFPLTDPDEANSLGQAYVGPVVLITDALCYSTTDIFVAGFRDHGIGAILGVDGNTGAGGANVWTDELLRQMWNEPSGPLRPMPKGSGLRIAIRQSTRVGSSVGLPLEDLGVAPDPPVHRMTPDDVLSGNRDLLATAAKALDLAPRRRLDVTAGLAKGGIKVTVKTFNVDRVDIFSDGRAEASVDVQDGASAHVLRARAGTTQLEIRGYQAGMIVAARRIVVK